MIDSLESGEQQLSATKINQQTHENFPSEGAKDEKRTRSPTQIVPKAKLPFSINPKLSIIVTNHDLQSKKTKLEIYKEHLGNVRARKSTIPEVPEPSILKYFNLLKGNKQEEARRERLRKQVKDKKDRYEKLMKNIDKYREIYEVKEEAMKERLLLSKILGTKLQSEFEKTKEKFKELEFTRIMNISQKKLCYYQLAEVFFNNDARNLFSLDSTQHNDEAMGIYLGYLGFLIMHVARLAGVQTWIGFKFKGSRSTITVYDSKVIEHGGLGPAQQGREWGRVSFTLHPKQPRLNQALSLLSEQLKQIMKYWLHMPVDGKSNFYELCEELSKCLLNL